MGGLYDAPGWQLGQPVMNQHWPSDPLNVTRHPRSGYPVRVRVVWRDDGVEWLEGRAVRWDAGHVYVEISHEPRLDVTGAWVKPEDVYRAAPEEPEDETAPSSD